MPTTRSQSLASATGVPNQPPQVPQDDNPHLNHSAGDNCPAPSCQQLIPQTVASSSQAPQQQVNPMESDPNVPVSNGTQPTDATGSQPTNGHQPPGSYGFSFGSFPTRHPGSPPNVQMNPFFLPHYPMGYPYYPLPPNGPPSQATSFSVPPQQAPRGLLVQPPAADNYRPPTSNHKALITRFSGKDRNVRVSAWLSLYEVATFDYAPRDRVYLLCRYLSDDAMDWYSDSVIPRLSTISWEEVKQSMEIRFPHTAVRPILAAQERYLRKDEEVEDYHKEKLRFLRQTPLDELDMVALLTKGMPSSYKPNLISAQPQTTEQWLQIALALQTDIRRQLQKTNNRQQRPQGATSRSGFPTVNKLESTHGKKEKIPDKPCKYCKEEGREEFHWHSKCPIRPPITRSATIIGENSVNTMVALTGLPTAPGRLVTATIRVKNRNVDALLDSGATHNLMDEKIRRMLRLPIHNTEQLAFKQVKGLVVSLGCAKVIVTLNGINKLVLFHIIDGLSFDALLSLETQGLFGIVLDTSTKRFSTTPITPPRGPKIMAIEVATPPSISPGPQSPHTPTVPSELSDLADVFAKDEDEVGCIPGVIHEIKVKTNKPVYQRARRKSLPQRIRERRAVKRLLALGLIKPSKSPHQTNIHLIPKKTGNDRIIQDLVPLNEVIDGDNFPLPQIADVVDTLQGAKFFTVVDIAHGYWHVKLHPDSTQYTAFPTEDGLFEWTVMPMGLKNAPATFQRAIKNILIAHHGYCLNYLDDIIIYSKSREEHIIHVRRVLAALRENNIKLRSEKCKFFGDEIEYLGFFIKNDTLRPNPTKLTAVKDYAPPKSKREVYRFLGLTSYFRIFIHNYTELAYPLQVLTRKATPFVFGPKQMAAFRALQTALTTPPILCIYNPDLECELYTDASGVGIGSILIQRPPPDWAIPTPNVDKDSLPGVPQNDRHPPRVIAYFSKRLAKEQENWSTTDQESLAVIESIERFDVYLRSKPFKVFTDHSALQFIHTSHTLKGRLLRWFVRLSTYSFSIHHRSGTQMRHADALSRASVEPPHYQEEDEWPRGNIIDTRDSPSCQVAVRSLGIPSPLPLDEIKKAQKADDLSYVSNPKIIDDLTCIKRKGHLRIVVPSAIRLMIIHYYHNSHGHPGPGKTTKMVAMFYWWPKMAQDIKSTIDKCDTCQISKVPTGPVPGEMQIMPAPSSPLELFAMDTIVVGSSATETSAKYIQVIIDQHSRKAWAISTKRIQPLLPSTP